MADLRLFVECSTKTVFNSRLSGGDITNDHIVFIKDTNQIYHNGIYYGLGSADVSDTTNYADITGNFTNPS